MFALGILGIVISMVVLAISIASLVNYEDDGKIGLVFGILILAVSIIMTIGGTESNTFKRQLKDIQSDYSDGIHRIITVTAEDGRTIYTYEGTVDLEINGEERKIKFEDENGNRQIVIYGIQDTVTIIEN
jgi:uncharacterized membrane protein